MPLDSQWHVLEPFVLGLWLICNSGLHNIFSATTEELQPRSHICGRCRPRGEMGRGKEVRVGVEVREEVLKVILKVYPTPLQLLLTCLHRNRCISLVTLFFLKHRLWQCRVCQGIYEYSLHLHIHKSSHGTQQIIHIKSPPSSPF